MTGKHRLFIEKITSVGAVEQADNPHSSIVFWKSRPKPEPTRLEKAVQRKRNVEAIRKWAEESDAQLAEIRKGLEELREIPLQRGGTMPKPTDPIQVRDTWVEKNQKADESVFDARSRFWKTHPDMAELDRAKTGLSSIAEKRRPGDSEPKTVGEMTAVAIDKRARQFHLDGLHGDMSLAEVRSMIRTRNPVLKQLERSTETYETVKKSAPGGVTGQALDFIREWAE